MSADRSAPSEARAASPTRAAPWTARPYPGTAVLPAPPRAAARRSEVASGA